MRVLFVWPPTIILTTGLMLMPGNCRPSMTRTRIWWCVMDKRGRMAHTAASRRSHLWVIAVVQRTHTCMSCGLLGKVLGWLLAPLLLFLSPPWVLLDGGERLGVWAAGDSWPEGPCGPTMTMECPSSAPWSSTGSSMIMLSVSSSPKVSREITAF